MLYQLSYPGPLERRKYTHKYSAGNIPYWENVVYLHDIFFLFSIQVNDDEINITYHMFVSSLAEVECDHNTVELSIFGRSSLFLSLRLIIFCLLISFFVVAAAFVIADVVVTLQLSCRTFYGGARKPV